jgi:hypothetical protein
MPSGRLLIAKYLRLSHTVLQGALLHCRRRIGRPRASTKGYVPCSAPWISLHRPPIATSNSCLHASEQALQPMHLFRST